MCCYTFCQHFFAKNPLLQNFARLNFRQKRTENLSKLIEKFGMNSFYVNIAKTQFSFSDDKKLLGAPKDFTFNITDIEIRSGAKMMICQNSLQPKT